jgi:ParB family chromosome partitioning protein
VPIVVPLADALPREDLPEGVSVGTHVFEVRISQVTASPYQPRKHFDEAALDTLAESIKRSGLVQPIVIRERRGAEREHTKWELVAGERRWRAAERAGLKKVPAIVVAIDDERAAEWALVENLQREDLNPIDRAGAMVALAERFGLSHGEIAERVGLDRTSVTNLVRLLELEPAVQQLIAMGALGLGHGRALLACAPGSRRIDLAKRAVREQMSVRQIESEVRERGGQRRAGGKDRSAALVDLEKQFGDYLGTKVSLRTSGKRGKIVIEFFDLDHFDALASRMGFVARG